MIPSLVYDIDGFGWSDDDDVAREMDDLAMEGLEGVDAGARLELEDEGALTESSDDDIGRAAEEIEMQYEGG